MTSYYITISSEPSYQLFKLTDECSYCGAISNELSTNLLDSGCHTTVRRFFSIKDRIAFLNNQHMYTFTYIGPVSDPLDFPKLYPEYFI